MKKTFQIGSFVFQINYPQSLIIPPNFLKFETTGEFTYTYDILIQKQLPKLYGQIIASRNDLLVYEYNGLESRYLGIKGQEDYYASVQEIDSHHALITIMETKINELKFDPIFTSLFALERRMIERKSLTLHCAYLQVQNSAILFSAPSGTGKSTQANLWEQYEQGKTINGDRGLLHKVNDQWFVGGWPVCGTSKICNNITLPIKAIVMLSQSTQNHLESLKGIKAIQSLYAQTTINYWNQTFVNQSLDLLEDIITHIPIYHLSCDISLEAVNCLKEKITI